jgi:hypothetical protein
MKFSIGDMFVEATSTENIFWIFLRQDANGLHLEAGKRKIRYSTRFQLKQLISCGIYQYFPVVK